MTFVETAAKQAQDAAAPSRDQSGHTIQILVPGMVMRANGGLEVPLVELKKLVHDAAAQLGIARPLGASECVVGLEAGFAQLRFLPSKSPRLFDHARTEVDLAEDVARLLKIGSASISDRAQSAYTDPLPAKLEAMAAIPREICAIVSNAVERAVSTLVKSKAIITAPGEPRAIKLPDRNELPRAVTPVSEPSLARVTIDALSGDGRVGYDRLKHKLDAGAFAPLQLGDIVKGLFRNGEKIAYRSLEPVAGTPYEVTSRNGETRVLEMAQRSLFFDGEGV